MLLVLLVGCSASDGAAIPGTENDTVLAVSTPAPAEVTVATNAATTPTTAAATTTTVAIVAEDPGIADELGLDGIELLTAAEGGGTRPILEWSAVDGATDYHVVVLGPGESTYWAWRTAETSVPVGGLPQLSSEAAGPSISPGMSWSVLAVAEDGTPLALSGRRDIAP